MLHHMPRSGAPSLEYLCRVIPVMPLSVIAGRLRFPGSEAGVTGLCCIICHDQEHRLWNICVMLFRSCHYRSFTIVLHSVISPHPRNSCAVSFNGNLISLSALRLSVLGPGVA